MSTPAGGLIGDATINVNANTTAAALALRGLTRDANGQLRDLRGRFVSEGRLINGSLTQVTASSNKFKESLGSLRSASLLLSPALIPIAAQAAPIAASVGAAGIAIGAFAAAAAGQATAISAASDAEQKYQDEIAKHGATSKQAAQAQNAYVASVQQMPPATRTTAAALSSLKDQYQQWSDSLASNTMPVATKALQAFSSIFPKLTPLVTGASGQLDRFVTIAAGGIASPGLDALIGKFATFSTGSLQKANDALVHFVRTINTGKVSGGVNEFMEYARQNGPLVKDTLEKVVTALLNVMQAASNVGPGLLTVVNAFAGLVSALPPSVITAMLQLALALKAVRIAAVAMGATSTGVTAFATAIGAMRTAAAGASSGVGRLTAAFGALSRGAKVAAIGTGVGLLLITLTELSKMGRKAPPDVDKLTTSLGRLGTTGKASGEGVRLFGKNLSGLYDSVKNITDPSTTDKIQQGLVKVFSLGMADSTPHTEAKEKLDAIDDALTNLARGGKTDEAAAAFQRLSAQYVKGGGSLKDFKAAMDGYNSTLDDQKLEAQFAAQAMGLFGTQAQQTSAKLAEQKQSADGLRQAIQALNDVQRAGLGGMIGFEAAIDNASKAARDNAGALSMTNGVLNLGSEKARNAATALQDLASKTDDAASSARESGASWETVNGIYTRGRDALIKNAQAMGLSKSEAKALADQILKIPDKTAKVKMEKADATRDLNAFNAAVKHSPGSKSVTLKTLSSGAEKILESFGFKVKRLPNGKVTVSAKTGSALSGIRNVQGAVNRLHGKTITVTTFLQYKGKSISAYSAGRMATGGRVGYPTGGRVEGPGTGTSDSVPIMASKGEYVVNAASTEKYLPIIEAINAGTFGAGVGMAGAGGAVAAGLAQGMVGGTGQVTAAAKTMAAAVTKGVKDELQIASPSRKMKAVATDIGKGFISGLTGSQAKIKSVSADLAKDVRNAFSGRKESKLIGLINADTKKLTSLAAKRDKLSATIATANKFATDTASAARSTGSLSSIVQQDAYSPQYVKGQMQASLNQIKAFTSNVQKLQKKGLNKDLLRQILEMGPEQGGAFAKALAGADKATIKQYNSLNTQISSASSKLGKSGADMLYDSGKKAGNGFLAGLKAQQKDIEKLMLSIAKSMQKSIKKALGIKSPSRVMQALGHMSILGLEGGILARVPAVETAMQRVAGAVASGVSTVPSAGSLNVGTARAASMAAGTVVHEHHYHVNLTNQGAIGSRIELQNWFVKIFDDIARQRRVPVSLIAQIKAA